MTAIRFKKIQRKWGSGLPYIELLARQGRRGWFHVKDCRNDAEAEAEIERRSAPALDHAYEAGAYSVCRRCGRDRKEHPDLRAAL